MRFMAIRERSFDEITALKPRICIVIKGVIATMATTPYAKLYILPSPCTVPQAPIKRGKIKLEVSGPLATPPESKAIPV